MFTYKSGHIFWVSRQSPNKIRFWCFLIPNSFGPQKYLSFNTAPPSQKGAIIRAVYHLRERRFISTWFKHPIKSQSFLSFQRQFTPNWSHESFSTQKLFYIVRTMFLLKVSFFWKMGLQLFSLINKSNVTKHFLLRTEFMGDFNIHGTKYF